MGRGGGVSSRGRGKFKISRGGGRHFSRDLDPREVLKGRANRGDDEDSDEEDSEDEESSEDEDEVIPNRPAPAAGLSKEMAAMNLKLGNTEAIEDPEEGLSRAEKKALRIAQSSKKSGKPAKKVTIKEESESESGSEDDSDDSLLNPGKATAQRQAQKAELSRKEKEAADKKAAQDRYAKLHAQGKTTEAKTDLARLQEVRRRREAAAAQREAEADEAAKEAEAKKAKAAGKR